MALQITIGSVWNRLKSILFRGEEKDIIYIWKIIEKMVPNISESIKTTESPRLCRMCALYFSNYKTEKYRDGILAVQGAKLFNLMPKSIRILKNISIDKFKNALWHSPEVYTGWAPNSRVQENWLKLNHSYEKCLLRSLLNL